MTELSSLREVRDAILLGIHAQPGARRNAIVGIHDGRLKVSVVPAPENGKANLAIVQLLSAQFGLSRSQIAVQSGASSKKKVCRIAGISSDELQRRINEYLDSH